MSAKDAITVKALFPEDAAQYLVDLLRGKIPFDRWSAIGQSWKMINYLIDLFGSQSAIASTGCKLKITNFKSGKRSKKAITDALAASCSKDIGAKFALPAWLLPILLDLVQKWLADGGKL